MPLDLLVFNPRKKRKNKKSRGRSARARTRKRKAAKKHAAKSAAKQGGRTMASKKGRKGRRGRKGRGRRFTANTSTPPASGRRRRHSGGGGGGRFSVRGLFDMGTIMEGVIVGGAVSLSGIGADLLINKVVKPNKPLNGHVMSAVQIGIGVAGQAALKMIGLGRYAKSFMVGAVTGGVLNSYGIVKANMAKTSAQRDPGTQAGMGRIGGFVGPGSNAPGFSASGAWTPSRVVA